jgi:GT2 family glycosyltransferase
MDPSVSIVLLNWNSAEHTIECIESLLEINYDRFNIIVVDNNSEEKHLELIRDYMKGKRGFTSEFVDYKQNTKPLSFCEYNIDEIGEKKYDVKNNRLITLIKNNSNDGFPGGCNIGIRLALSWNSDYVLLLNNDVVVDKQFLNELVKATESETSIGIAGSKIYHYDEPDRIQSVGGDMLWWMFWPLNYRMNEIDDEKSTEVTERDFVWATSQLINANLFRDVGLLDEKFFFGIEEYDLCDRAKKKGYNVVFVPSSKVWHKGNASAKKLSKYAETKSLIKRETGFLDYKLISHALRKHYGRLVWMVPFILRYLAHGTRFLCNRLKEDDGKSGDNI